MTGRRGVLAAAALLVAGGGCSGPPADRSEARARVEAVAESLRAAHEEAYGVATPEELERLREETEADSVGAARDTAGADR